MNNSRMRGLAAGAISAALGAAGLCAPAIAGAASPKAAPTVTPVATGLNVPKYLTIRGSSLYVAESGRGGTQCTTGVGIMSTSTRECAGPTGAIARITGQTTKTVVSGLTSVVDRSTGEVVGPIALSFYGGRPAVLERDAFPGATGVSGIPDPLGKPLGKLVGAPAHEGGPLRTLGDVARFQARKPQPAATVGGLPGELVWDSDPHDVVAYHGGYAVADAGANDVVFVKDGRVSLLARLPATSENAPAGALGPGSPALTIDAQAVPSSLTVGPDGALYVGLLRGVPSLPGTADVYRVVPGQDPTPVVTGLTRVSDVAFDHEGRLLILESSTKGEQPGPGALLRATPNGGAPVQATDLGVTGLDAPTGLAVGPADVTYVTNRTAKPGAGQVLKITGL